ncbi:MAG: hypothetical protein GXP42_08695 [Chloroflexi bacterium]|nr:hypothetical protein [Chloroflexota bacterium]
MKSLLGLFALLGVFALVVGMAFVIWLGPTIFPSTIRPPRGAIAAGDLETTTIGVYLYSGQDVHSPAAMKLGRVGARWTRLWFSWHWIEPARTEPPTYLWTWTDEAILAARQAGLEPIFLLGGNAAWASDTFCGPIHPRFEADFQRFLRDAVRRYSAPPYRVKLWEIYNEPDSVFGPQGYCFGTRGHLYPQTLRLAYEAIKEADPQAKVLFGGISYDFFTNEGGRFDPAFLDDALAAGAGPYFDIFAFHYYPAFAERWNAFGPGVAGKAAYLRQELARYGLEKPLALTEIGRPTRGPATDPASYDEIATARFVAPALALAKAADIAPIIWFTAVDKPAEPYDYGLLDASYRPEPSFFAYKAVLPALQGATYVGEWPVEGSGSALRFRKADVEVIVAWAHETEAVLTLKTARVRLVDRKDQARILYDGGSEDLDGRSDGHLRLRLTVDPIILWPL